MTPEHRPLRVQRRALNLGCGRDVRQDTPDEAWTNADAFATEDPRVVPLDMVRTPWPFPDGAFHMVLASHVLEHVPPIFNHRDGAWRDVMFDVLEEVHRVLHPDGRFIVRVPDGESPAYAWCHPQHYRAITPAWFSYFTDEHAENYYSTARFATERVERRPWGVKWHDRLRIRGVGLTSHLAARSARARRWLRRADELTIVMRKAHPRVRGDARKQEEDAPARASRPAHANESVPL